MTTSTQWVLSKMDSQRRRVERWRLTALLPLVSSARSPNRACTFRYALGSPGTTVKLSSAPLIKLALNAE
jgi:hypothetical protein